MNVRYINYQIQQWILLAYDNRNWLWRKTK